VRQGITPCGKQGAVCGRFNGDTGTADVEAGNEETLYYVSNELRQDMKKMCRKSCRNIRHT
jgi:hypothetical protein